MNLGNIDAEYNWENISDENFQVSITPSSGQITAKSKQKLTVVITPLRTTSLDAALNCHIKFIK